MNARVVTGCDPKGQIFSFNGIMGNWVWVLWFLFKKKQKKNKQTPPVSEDFNVLCYSFHQSV